MAGLKELGPSSDVYVTYSHDALQPYSNSPNSAVKNKPSKQNGDERQPAGRSEKE